MHNLHTLTPFTLMFFLTACVQSTSVKQAQVKPRVFPPPPATTQACDQVHAKNQQAFDLYQQGQHEAAQRLLETAIQNCPRDAKSHNNLADIIQTKGDDDKAMIHYRQAVALNPNLSEAWHGLGEIYYQQGRFPLSLEAHLHACQTDADSKQRVTALLKDNRYAVTEAGDILDKESLLLLYDKQRRQAINDMISACGLRGLSRIDEPVATFRNFQFNSGKANLEYGSERQLDEIAAALQELPNQTIKIYGHTDTQPFPNTTPSESKRRNQELSLARANSVAQKLSSRGVAHYRLKTEGFGQEKPLVRGNNPAAWAKNRRVEIEVD
ncbi:secreted protein containing Outer membrane protein, OmpA/MotB [Candidatus Thiomargarita nelsonii]|uniref:Secreted protein containing Outer membrane protein, OmpA/MotB n=1 Tax=Candidatus Thiomargarita nelsonii TaxID=1003181 RepID=A0A176S749_9GAMM|nr:secreted protein containing Outer membrane protein, OmpA/MotB [Candidatus Thiomargarita nelsonii]